MTRVTSKIVNSLGSITVNPLSLTPHKVAIKKGFIAVPQDSKEVDPHNQLAATLQAELMQLGYMLDQTAFHHVIHAPKAWITAYYEEIIPYLRKIKGADRSYKPFYRNFPTQVMEMSHFELFLNAIIHYWSNGTWEPPQTLKERGIHFENVDFKMIRSIDESSFLKIFTQMVSINQSLTEDDKSIVAWFIDTYGIDNLTVPSVIPFKETLCILASKRAKVTVKDPTDVLRVAVYMSGGDISLPSKGCKFRKFTRSERRYLLDLLSGTNLNVEDMQRHLGQWLRLGEKLHPGEYVSKFPHVVEAFRKLRDQPNGEASEFSQMPRTKIRTFHSQVDSAFAESLQKGVDTLSARPGEFARRLDWMLRNHPLHWDYILSTFDSIGPRVSSKVLFELYSHFQNRQKEGAPRVVRFKSKRAKMKTLPQLHPLPVDMVQAIQNTIMSILSKKAAILPSLGKVWIDERLKQVPIPFSMRSINASVKTYVRGTHIPFRNDAKVIRPFIHWNDEHGRIDLDLSVGLYNAKLSSLGHISFTCLKSMGCCHSGDIRHRVGPCAEYVDLPIQTLVDYGVRYAVVHVHNYNGNPLHDVKECVFGLMERENAVASEIFVPKTISNCMSLANEGTSVIVCIIDLVNRDYIWADTECDRGLPVLETTSNLSGEILRSLIHGCKMSVYDLLSLHATSRGKIVSSQEDADLQIRWEDMVTDYTKVAQYMNI